jgi:hypothetical protein
MQEHCGNLEAIQFGTIHVKCASPGNLYVAKNLNQKEFVYTSQSHLENSALADNFGSDSVSDSLHKEASAGLACVGMCELGQKSAIVQVLPTAVLAQHAANGQQLHATRQALSDPASSGVETRAADAANGHAAAIYRPGATTCRGAAGAGSSVQRKGEPSAAVVSPRPQRIPPC